MSPGYRLRRDDRVVSDLSIDDIFSATASDSARHVVCSLKKGHVAVCVAPLCDFVAGLIVRAA